MSRTRDVKRYLQLATALAGQEFPGAYRGNLTGALAAIAVPLAMLATYVFVFSRLIPVRIRPEQTTSDYALFLLSGLVVWNLIADVVVRSPRLFSAASHYVQRAGFPASLLVLAPCLASLYRSLPWLAAYAMAQLWLVGSLPWTLFVAPLVLFAASLIALGLALGLASLGAVLRDLGDAVPPVVTLAFFLSPVLYPATRLGEVSEWLLLLNPAASPIRIMQHVAYEGVVPDATLMLQLGLAATGSVALGWLFYRTVRGSLQDLV